jgi:YVTN family beta-propeller protein
MSEEVVQPIASVTRNGLEMGKAHRRSKMTAYRKYLSPTLKAFIVAVLSVAGAAQAAPFAYVSNGGGGTVSVIDTAVDTVVETIAVADPGDVVVHPEGHTVYVASGASISLIDATNNTVVGNVAIPAQVNAMAVHAAGTYLYVASEDSTVYVVDTASNAITADVPLGWTGLWSIAAHPDGERVYVGGEDGWGWLGIIDTNSNTLVTETSANREWYVAVIAVHPDGDRLYALEWGEWDSSIHALDAATLEPVSGWLYPGDDTADLAIDPAGTFLYATSIWGDGRVFVLDTVTNAFIDEVALDAQPSGIDVHPDGNSVYTTHASTDSVSVIDTATNTVTDSVGVGSGPAAIAVGPLPDGIGGSAGGYASLARVGCINRSSGQGVNIVPAPGATSWDCQAAGLIAETGDVIFMNVIGASDSDNATTIAGGTLGLSELRDVSCRDQTSGQALLIEITDDSTAWDCEASGLVVNPDDRVWMRIRGRAE